MTEYTSTTYTDIYIEHIRLVLKTLNEKQAEIEDTLKQLEIDQKGWQDFKLKMEHEIDQNALDEYRLQQRIEKLKERIDGLEEQNSSYEIENKELKEKLKSYAEMMDFLRLECKLDMNKNYSLYDLNRIKKAISDLELY